MDISSGCWGCFGFGQDPINVHMSVKSASINHFFGKIATGCIGDGVSDSISTRFTSPRVYHSWELSSVKMRGRWAYALLHAFEVSSEASRQLIAPLTHDTGSGRDHRLELTNGKHLIQISWGRA
jgi:hypothetical protein